MNTGMFRHCLTLFALLLAAAPSPAVAWGEFAHKTIADIASVNVSAPVHGKMRALFAQQALLGTPQCPLSDIRDASVWADCVRRDSLRWGYTGPWHYQNVDICREFSLTGPCANGNCAAAQIDRNAALLAERALPAHIRLEALAFLVHFVGDMHMPLHAGDRGDRGGNDVRAAYGIIEGRMNLHWLWDGPLAERSISDGPALVRSYSNAERAELASGSTQDWAMEAWQIAREHSYRTAEDRAACGPPLGETRAQVDDAEIAALVPVVRQQVIRAGLRLARLLEEALR
jgi:hypothetical protein